MYHRFSDTIKHEYQANARIEQHTQPGPSAEFRLGIGTS